MSGRRGRKKAPAKHQQLSQDADDELLNPDSTVKPTAPAPPASPFVALATQAISPIVAAARAVTTAAAVVLPTIPEAHAAVAAQALDVDHVPDATPRSPTSPLSPHATNNPFTAPATLKQTRSRTVGFGVATTVHQNHDADDLLKQNGYEQDQDRPCANDAGPASNSRSLPADITSFLARFSSGISSIIMLLSLLGLLGLALQQRSALHSQKTNILQQQQQVTAQAAALESLQQQLQQAKQQLQQLPDQQQLEAVAATCSIGLQDLNMTQALLNSTLEQLETAAQQLAANVTAVQQTSKVGVQAWEVLSAAMGPESFPNLKASHTASGAQQSSEDDAAPAAVAGAAAGSPAAPQALLLQRYAEQQVAAQLLKDSQHVLESIPAKVKLEVQQQLAVKLPPLDVALADCGARVVFHTALNNTRLLQEALTGNSWLSAAGFEFAISNLAPAAESRQPPASIVDQNLQGVASGDSAVPVAAPGTAPAAQQGPTSVLHGLHTFIASHLHQLLQSGGTTAVNATAAAAAAVANRDQQRKLLQQRLQRELMALDRISTLLLRPAGQAAGSCLPLLMQDGAPAVVEIALPQMMEVYSVTLHSPASTQLQGSSDDAAFVFRQAPAHITLALVNSSSCTTVTSGISTLGQDKAMLCSTAALRSKGGSTASNLDSVGASLHTKDSHVDVVGAAAVFDQSTSAAGGPSEAEESSQGPADGTKALLLDGVVERQIEVQLTADNYVAGNGRVVVSMQQARQLSGEESAEGAGSDAATGNERGSSRGVFADRLVVQASTSVGGGSEVCLQRISVQGAPTDAATFC